MFFVWSPLCSLLNYFDAVGKIYTPASKKQISDDPGVKSNLNLVFQEWVRRKNRFWGGKRKRSSLRRISEGGEFWRLEWSLRSRCRILVKEFARILMMKIMKNHITGDMNREYQASAPSLILTFNFCSFFLLILKNRNFPRIMWIAYKNDGSIGLAVLTLKINA